MFKKLVISFVFLLPMMMVPVCLQAYASAHVIVISHYGFDKNQQPKKFVVFGLTQKGELSTFGGLKDKGENNPKDTAAREAEEEALGVIGNTQTVRKMLRGINPSSGTNSGHLTYVLPGKYYGNNISRQFKKVRFDKKKKLSHSQKEMVDLVAVRVEEIRKKVKNGEKLVFTDNQGQLRPVRGPVGGALINAVQNGDL